MLLISSTNVDVIDKTSLMVFFYKKIYEPMRVLTLVLLGFPVEI